MAGTALHTLASAAETKSKIGQPMETASDYPLCIAINCTNPRHVSTTGLCLSHHMAANITKCATPGCPQRALVKTAFCTVCNEQLKVHTHTRQPENPSQPVYGMTTFAGL
jgi:hypothetical protein